MRKNGAALIAGALLLIVSLLTWGYQLARGLIVTNMRNPFDWGLYIATFAFFVGIAAGGLIVSSSVYLFNIQALKPFTRIASLSAFASTLGAGAMILPDMGRVDRVLNVFIHPNFRSPLVWDVAVISAYLVVTFFSVFVQLVPDGRKDGSPLLRGGKSAVQLKQASAKWSRRISIVGLPIAILIHTVTALIFAVQASRPYWNTATLPPDFIAVAVASGTALVMLMFLLAVGREGFAQHKDALRTFARIIAGALAVHFCLVAMDLIVHGWWGSEEALATLSLVFGRYGMVYAVELILPACTMFLFFSKNGPSYNRLLLGSALLFIGVFAHRLMLMLPTFNAIPLTVTIPGLGLPAWTYPAAIGELKEGMPVFVSAWNYVPSAVEAAIALLPFGLVTLVAGIGFRLFNLLPGQLVSGPNVERKAKAPIAHKAGV